MLTLTLGIASWVTLVSRPSPCIGHPDGVHRCAGPQASPDYCKNCCASTSTCTVDPATYLSASGLPQYLCCEVQACEV